MRHPPPMTPTGSIRLRGVREPPLPGGDLTIPLGRIVCLSGAMGAGVEALAHRVLLAESRRRYLLSMSPFERARLGGVGAAAEVDGIEGLPPAQALPAPPGGRTVGTQLHLYGDLSRLARGLSEIRCPGCGGRCAALDEEGVAGLLEERFPAQTVWFVAPMELEDAASRPGVLDELGRAGFRRLRAGTRLHRLEEVDEDALAEEGLEVVVDRLAPGAARTRARVGEAVRNARALASGASLLVGEKDGQEVWTGPRLTCGGCGAECEEPDWERVTAAEEDGPQSIELKGRPLGDWAREARLRQVADLAKEAEPRWPEPAGRLLRALAGAVDLGLEELPLTRPVADLSHGEQLLLGLAAALSGGLSGILHVVLSPLSALDRSTRDRVARGLRRLVERGNSAVVVDGHPSAGEWADEVIHIGPAPSATAAALRGAARPPAAHEVLDLVVGEAPAGCDTGPVPPGPELCIPLGRLALLAGPTGSGKTALLHLIFRALSPGRDVPVRPVRAPAVRRCIDVGAEARSPAGEQAVLMDRLGAMRPLARLLARGPAAEGLGLEPRSFLLDRPGGRCSHCEGAGVVRHRLEVMEDFAATCPRCEGRRFGEEVLQVTGRGVNVAEVLAMTVEEGAAHFRRERGVHEPLAAAVRYGLAERRLGEGVDGLEEAERLLARLAGHAVRAREDELLLLDRPTAGCRPETAGRVAEALLQFASRGVSLLVADGSGDLEALADLVVRLHPRHS